MTDPIFIVGVPRSGTTLMRSVLSAHRNVTIAPETHFLDVFARLAGDGLADRPAFDRFWAAFTADAQFAELGLDPGVIATAIHASRDYSLRNVFQTTLQQYARKMGKARWGEKTPEHYRHLGLLLDWFPTARVIHMLRDPRAVCASLMAVPWRIQPRQQSGRLEPVPLMRSRRVHHDAVVWREACQQYSAQWKAEPRVKLVQYEQLVQAPAETLAAVCEFIGEPYDAAMVAGRSWNSVPPPPQAGPSKLLQWRYQHVRRTLDEITTAPISKWRTELTPWEVGLIERICGETMQAHGYELSRRKPVARLASQVGVMALAGVWAVRRQIAAKA